MFKCIKHDIPVIYMPGMVGGATTPVSKAGMMVLINSECLAGIVMSQLKKKGAKIIMGGGATPMDMRTTAILYGSPEASMNYAIITQMAQLYGLCNFAEAGCVNSPQPDLQAGIEAAVSILMTKLEGCSIVHDVGYLEGGKTGYLPFLALCNEMISMSRYIGGGTKINKDLLSADVIDQVGPGGNYLMHPNTCKLFKEEIW